MEKRRESGRNGRDDTCRAEHLFQPSRTPCATRWAWCCATRRSRRTSVTGSISPARCSMREGGLCAQAAHIPVHLGSMAFAMRDIVAGSTGRPATSWSSTTPSSVAPICRMSPWSRRCMPRRPADRLRRQSGPSRRHRGGLAPGSMPISSSLQEEGVVIPPTLLYRAGERVEAAHRQIARRDPQTDRVRR
jgi:hypothetical protein